MLPIGIAQLWMWVIRIIKSPLVVLPTGIAERMGVGYTRNEKSSISAKLEIEEQFKWVIRRMESPVVVLPIGIAEQWE